jgi:hypothetical protein
MTYAVLVQHTIQQKKSQSLEPWNGILTVTCPSPGQAAHLCHSVTN